MQGLIYRIAIRLKDLGETFHFPPLIRLGYAVRELVWKK